MIRTVDATNPDPALIREAAELLTAGKLVILPTETVYGVACDPRVPGAEDAVYRAKGRPAGKPIARFIRYREDLFPPEEEPNPLALALAGEFMPGPLTLVLPFLQDWVGFRIPDHPIPLALLDALGAPLAVTSANRSGESDPTTAEEAEHQLQRAVELTLDAGPCALGQASTVIRVNGNSLEVLREGALTKERIFETARRAGFENNE